MRTVFFGCSHTQLLTRDCFQPNNEESYLYKANSGNSNDKIIWDVYEFVNSEHIDLDNDLLYIQFSYTNRFWRPNILPESNYSFHTLHDNGPIFSLNPSFLRKDLRKMYEVYLTYFWDINLHFNYLVQQIDMLKSYLDSKNIKYIFSSWTDGGNTDEWRVISGLNKTKNEDTISYKKFDEMGCIKIDGFRFIESWAVKNNLLDDSLHLTKEGNILFSKFLKKIIKEKF